MKHSGGRRKAHTKPVAAEIRNSVIRVQTDRVNDLRIQISAAERHVGIADAQDWATSGRGDEGGATKLSLVIEAARVITRAGERRLDPG